MESILFIDYVRSSKRITAAKDTYWWAEGIRAAGPTLNSPAGSPAGHNTLVLIAAISALNAVY